MPNREQLVEQARTWKGTPWRHQGRTRQAVDCVGLVIQVAKHFTLFNGNYDEVGYSRQVDKYQFLAKFAKQMDRVPLYDRQIGDVLVFRESQYPCHCGILTSVVPVEMFTHAYAIRRKTVEEDLTEDWKSKLVAVFTFRGLDIWQF